MLRYINIVLFATVFFSQFCYSDVLIIDRIIQEHDKDMPKRGTSMQQVIATYGEPVLKKNAIGTPPITEWQYKDYSVYFEKEWVIDSVVYKASANEKGPKYIKGSLK